MDDSVRLLLCLSRSEPSLSKTQRIYGDRIYLRVEAASFGSAVFG